jgi:Mg/Co/Ni transporter MgtE
LFALSVTLIIEIPVLIIVSGGSGQLCRLVGRHKYELLMGFLPLCSAISGNVGLQASTLTTRAVSHRHITPKLFRKWLLTEIGAAVYLGFGMGFSVGCIAFFLSDYHFAFAFTVALAQWISIVTAGLTGTCAPLLFSFIFNRDPGKWGGPLETAIQDIIGSFAMVVMSYRVLSLFGPMEIDPTDTCV